MTFTFTPYGQPAILMQKLFDVKVPVIDWLPTDVARQSKWDLFLTSTLHAVNATLWPQWDAAAGQWSTGGVTLDDMDYLTEADFYLLDRMGPPARGLDDKPASPTADPACPTHRVFFGNEDERDPTEKKGDPRRPIGFHFGKYDTTAPPLLVANFSDWFLEGIHAKEGSLTSVSMQFKLRLHRPRAFHVALLKKRPYAHEFGLTAFTPSMSSGHCLQALIGGGAVLERAAMEGLNLSQANKRAVMQYAVDMGDRRVMAGIHYPSDNLCSWIVALRLAAGVYRDAAIASQIWTAITEQSRVFRVISESTNPAYERALRVLEASNPALEIAARSAVASSTTTPSS